MFQRENSFRCEKSAATLLSPSSFFESRQLVEGIVARVHPRRVSTCVSAEFRRIDTFPGDATGSEVTWENCQRRRRCSCFYSLVKTFFFFLLLLFPFSFQNRKKKKTRCKQGRAGSSWQRRHTTKDEACSINACTCELPSSRASTLDFLAVSRPGFASLVSLPRVMYRSIHESMNTLPIVNWILEKYFYLKSFLSTIIRYFFLYYLFTKRKISNNLTSNDPLESMESGWRN